MPLTTKMPRTADDFFCLPPSDWVDARALTAGVAETFTVPSGAARVNMAATADFYARYDGQDAAVPGDVTDGTASELNPSLRKLTGDKISVISAATCIVTATYYRAP